MSKRKHDELKTKDDEPKAKPRRNETKHKNEEHVDQYFDNMWLLVACTSVQNVAKLLKRMKCQEAHFVKIRVLDSRPHPRLANTEQALVVADLKHARESGLDFISRGDDARLLESFNSLFKHMVASLGDDSGILGIRLANNNAHEACSTKPNSSKPNSFAPPKMLAENQKVWLMFSVGVHRKKITKHEYYTIKTNLTSNLAGAAKFVQENNQDKCCRFSSLEFKSVRWSTNPTKNYKPGLFGKTRGKRFKRYSSFFNILALATIGDLNSQEPQSQQESMDHTAFCIDHSVSSASGWCFDYQYNDFSNKTANIFDDHHFEDEGCLSGLQIKVVA